LKINFDRPTVMHSGLSARLGLIGQLLLGVVVVLSSSAHLHATTLSVGGTPLSGVDVTNATYSGGNLDLVLSPGSSGLEPVIADLPEFAVPTGDLCGAAGSTVACVSPLGTLQDRVASDSIELRGGVSYASEFFIPQTVNPTLIVLEFRTSGSILPEINGSVTMEPAAGSPGANCSFVVSGYVGGRVYLAHDGSSGDFKSRFCTIQRGERYFLNLALVGVSSGSPVTVLRTVKLSGI
jgi:hypothetical protein